MTTNSIHATAVLIGTAGVLLGGPPGSGKSDLALRLIDRGAMLIADDRVLTKAVDGQLMLSAPTAISGMLEVRGLGLLRMPYRNDVCAGLYCDLTARSARLPEPRRITLDGIALPWLAIEPFSQSAPIRIELAVARLGQFGV